MTTTTMDDAFVDGWNFGRGFTHEVAGFYRNKTAPVHVRLEYERGVFEGHQFQENMDNRDMVMTVRGWERRI
jgi:hypothetical protein